MMMCTCGRSGQVTSALGKKLSDRWKMRMRERGIFPQVELLSFFDFVWLLERESVVLESNSKATLTDVDSVCITNNIWTANSKRSLGVNR